MARPSPFMFSLLRTPLSSLGAAHFDEFRSIVRRYRGTYDMQVTAYTGSTGSFAPSYSSSIK